MPQLKTPSFVERLETSLIEGLKQAGIEAEVEYERVPSTRLYRFIVLAKKFKPLPHNERQNLVWRIAEKSLADDEQFRVSMILTLTPEELKER